MKLANELLTVILLAGLCAAVWGLLSPPRHDVPAPAPIIVPQPVPGPREPDRPDKPDDPKKPRKPLRPWSDGAPEACEAGDSGEMIECDAGGLFGRRRPRPGPGPQPDPEPDPEPGPTPPGPPPSGPRGPIKVGGPTGPDGKTEVVCDLPVDQRKKNVGGRDGSGLCVFTSIMHAARWQSEHRLENFQQQMRAEPGGGYPSKVDKMIAKYGAGTPYLQYEGRDPAVLRAALATGRMVSVTYNGHDPHYGGTIAHMVNLVHMDDKYAVILDNNFVGENELVWLSIPDFMQRWTGGGGGWAVILLANPPAPPPKN